MLAARAEPEVAPADHKVARLDPLGELGVGVFEHVLGELGQVGAQVEQSARRDEVGRDVVAERPGASAQDVGAAGLAVHRRQASLSVMVTLVMARPGSRALPGSRSGIE